MRTSFKTQSGELQEIKAWLTRRLISNLWPGIVRALETQVALDRPLAAHAKAEIVNLEHLAAVSENTSKGNFDTPFQASAPHPLNESPILVAAAHFTVAAGKTLRINFTPEQGYGFEVAFTPDVLHGFCSLLQNSVRQAEWGMDLRLPGASPDYSAKPKLWN